MIQNRGFVAGTVDIDATAQKSGYRCGLTAAGLCPGDGQPVGVTMSRGAAAVRRRTNVVTARPGGCPSGQGRF